MAAKIVTPSDPSLPLDWLEAFSNHSTAQKEGICAEVTQRRFMKSIFILFSRLHHD
jgi:hypothetical protein